MKKASDSQKRRLAEMLPQLTIGEIARLMGFATGADLEAAAHQQIHGEPFGQTLIRCHVLTSGQLLRVIDMQERLRAGDASAFVELVESAAGAFQRELEQLEFHAPPTLPGHR